MAAKIKGLVQSNWDKLKTFYTIAQAGSFTKAALQMNMEQSSLSRSIQTFESSIGYPVFIRRQNGVSLTEEGQSLLKATQSILSTLTHMNSELDEQRNVPSGLLRVTPVVGIFPLYIAHHIPGFLKCYPDIRLAFFSTDIPPKLECSETDVMIYHFMDNRPDLVQRLLMSLHLYLYASPDYLQQFGTPKSPDDLDHHQLISSGTRHSNPFTHINWILSINKKSGQLRTPYIEENSSIGRMTLAKSGLGIVALPKEQPGLKESGFVPVLPSLKGPALNVYYTYSQTLTHSKRVNVFWDYLSKALRKKLTLPIF